MFFVIALVKDPHVLLLRSHIYTNKKVAINALNKMKDKPEGSKVYQITPFMLKEVE